MRITQALTGLICLLGVILFLYATPNFYIELRDHCIDQECIAFYDTPPSSEWLRARGLSNIWFAGAYTGLYALFGLIYMGVGLIVYRQKSTELIGQVAAIALVLQGFSFTTVPLILQNIHPVITFVVGFLSSVSFLALMTLFFLFPNGKFNPRWTRYLLIAILIPGVLKGLFPGTKVDLQTISGPLFMIWVLIWMVSLITIQIYRYRKVLGPLERQQTKWAISGMSVAIFGLLVITLAHILQDDLLQRNPALLFLSEVVLIFSMMLLPVSLLFALLRRKLWDIDPIVNRTLLYGMLSLFVIIIYISVVWYIGFLFQTASQWLNSLIATGLVAILFAPIKERLQRWINRFMYGENDDPLAVLVRLGQKLENPLSPYDALNVVVRTVKEALKLPYAGLSLHQSGETLIVAEEGEQQELPTSFPLVHRGETLGNLLVSARSPGESFSVSDHRFLNMLVHQTGAIVKSATASIDLHQVAEDLRDSRERLVLAREEERRRLRRNLHDDLAPRLAALALTASAAETLLQSDPARTKSILVELQTVIRSTVSDIRRLVHDLRPPALDELGLAGAIQERIHDLCRPLKPLASGEGNSHAAPAALDFRLHAPDKLPMLPAAVEVAAFRIVTEAIVNVVRHANATFCEVHIRLGQALEVEIIDDGQGDLDKLGRQSAAAGGIGTHSMRERAEELGGYCLIEAVQPRGTKVRAYLPITDTEQGSESA
ncbi:histidine kinase [Cohnella sp.]|uniref:GAF domain-containing sensor histidine kinase n=1 Tax=Cohnella sp. TaxID=1883426 RepID=UPI003561939A